MSTTTNLSTLKINYLTDAQYQTALDGGQINENEIYLTPSSDGGGTSVPTANSTAKFDAAAHMNSTDMTSSEVTNFVDGLDEQGISSELGVITFVIGTDLGTVLKRTGNLVTLSFAWTGSITGSTAVANIPTNFRPSTLIVGALSSLLVNNSQIHLQVETDGTIVIGNGSGNNYADFFYANLTWVK